MTAAEASPAASLPRWLPWAFVALLALPFHPFWLDFEQVRRGLLLVLAGGCLLVLPRLRPAAGEHAGWWFVGVLLVCALVNYTGQALTANDAAPMSFQPWEAVYRLAHWLALGVVLRLGAAAPHAFAAPIAGTLLVTSLYGLLQRFGIAAVAGYGIAGEPVSVFGNLNVAAEWTAIAAAVVAVLPPRAPWLRWAALAIASCYLVVDGSRSGLIALPLGLLLLWLLRRRQRGWLPLAVAAAGALCGLLVEVATPRPAPIDIAAEKAAAARAVATVDVRFEIAKGSSRLFLESPAFGYGPGQFPVQYPRVRSQTEIEISTHARKFASAVRTAHDDWLEVLVDGGLPALILFAWLLFALQRGAPDRARLVPLFVLLLLMLARSPLWNAPAVAAAVLLAGRPAVPTGPAWPVGAWLRRGLALLLLALGALPLLANTLFVPYQAARARAEQPPIDSLERAVAVMPFEPSFRQLLAQEQLFAGDLAAARRTAAVAVSLRPFEPQGYALLGEILLAGRASDLAAQMLRHGLQFDPPNPQLRVLLSTALAHARRHDAAVQAVVTDPHPLLRAQLGQHFRTLAELAERAGDGTGAARFAVERHFLQAIDVLGDPSPAALAAAGEHVKLLLPAMREADLLRTDLRGHVVSALHALDLGEPDTAIRLGEQAQELGVPLAAWQRALLGDKLEPLLRIEPWQPVLRR